MVPTKVTSRDCVFPLEGTPWAKKGLVKRWRKDGNVKSPRFVSGASRNEEEETEGSLTTNFQRLSFSFIGHGLVFEAKSPCGTWPTRFPVFATTTTFVSWISSGASDYLIIFNCQSSCSVCTRGYPWERTKVLISKSITETSNEPESLLLCAVSQQIFLSSERHDELFQIDLNRKCPTNKESTRRHIPLTTPGETRNTWSAAVSGSRLNENDPRLSDSVVRSRVDSHLGWSPTRRK
uniref:Uncharacterized protein n=1 Tax=Vespula pensylvanica TaxID=30213 RepID=A0A834P2P1_VESPE|nr:hypothetical protein H0235_008169 [Vespula pensylvanica]